MKTRRRFFVPIENIKDDEILINGKDVNHIRNVLRLVLGDNVAIFDGKGNRFFAEIISLTRKEVKCKILKCDQFQNESPVGITLGQSILKGTKIDEIVRRSCELGLTNFVPLMSQRCVYKIKQAELKKKTERWQKVAVEASKQSGRTRVPFVSKTINSIKEFCLYYENSEIKLIFQEDENNIRISELKYGSSLIKKIAILIGPEGGWTESEVKTAIDYGFRPISLGPRILRAETVPIAVISIMQLFWGDF